MIQENLRRASAELIIFHLLIEEDLYGYQIVQKIKNNSKGLFTLPEGTLYPVMYRLTSKGLVSEYHRIVSKRLRKYYHLEPDGLVCYKEMLEEYKSITEGIFNILSEGKGDIGD